MDSSGTTTDTSTTDAEAAVRETLASWMRAVEKGDLAGVLAHHTEDTVLFDVPPPLQFVGPEEYRRSWEGFFGYQPTGVFRFEELTVLAGSDVAVAYGLVRCGPEDVARQFSVRLTVGLRKVDGAWLIAHEHHSVPAEG